MQISQFCGVGELARVTPGTEWSERPVSGSPAVVRQRTACAGRVADRLVCLMPGVIHFVLTSRRTGERAPGTRVHKAGSRSGLTCLPRFVRRLAGGCQAEYTMSSR